MFVAEAVPDEAAEPSSATVVPVRYKLQLTPDRTLRAFSAQMLLDVEVMEPTQEVVVNSAELEIASARVDEQEEVQIDYDAARQRLSFTVARPLSRGRHTIVVRYGGRIGDSGPGLIRVLDGPQPQAEYLYTALCCGGRARYLAPMWDEAGSKAVFELELIVAEHLDAVSTMPVLHRTPVGDRTVRIAFPPTPKMTPHLFFFAVGPFERFARRHSSIDLGIVVPRGVPVNAALVLDSTVEAARYLGEYLGRPYPLPKLDSVLLPNAPGGAIANWGAIQYAQRYLTVRAPVSTREELQISYAMIAHEVAHQWFGNLVTPKDADHTWLSEGFAVWMENKIAAEFHPEWPSWLHASEYREAAMRLDGRAATHPVVPDLAAAEQRGPVDTEITYDKSAQVLRMIEAYVGEQAFAAAVREYVERNAYGSVVSQDFWKTLESVSALPVRQIGTDFTEQTGVPLIVVTGTRCSGGSSTVVLRQERFGRDARTRAPRAWRVPVSAMTMSQRADQGAPKYRIVSGTDSQDLTVPGCGPIKVNIGETGYFRTRYDAHSFAAIRSVFAALPAADQLGLLRDQYALAEAGYTSFDDYLDLASALSSQVDPFVNLQWVYSARVLDRLYRGRPDRAAFREFARAWFSKLLHGVGWEPQSREPTHMPLLRAALIDLLGQLQDDVVHAEAARRFAAAGHDPTKVPAVLREPIMKTIGTAIDLRGADELLERARGTDQAQEQKLLWLAVASASDRQVARTVLDRVSAEPAIPKDVRSSVLIALAASHPEDVYEHVEANTDVRVGEQVRLLLDVAGNSSERRVAERLGRFLSNAPQVPVPALARVRADILHRDDLRRLRLPQVSAWLSRQRAGR